MNDLEKFVYEKKHRVINKYPHYFEVYERHFSRFRGKEVTLVEIGIGSGGSLQMWADYLGPKARIIGVDIAECGSYVDKDHPQISWIRGDQGSVDFLRELKTRFPVIDILIDDGGHLCRDQILTFAELYPHVSPEGVYLCEDMQTSYSEQHGGGYLKIGSFVEFSKMMVDWINAWSFECPGFDRFARSTYSVNFYCGALVVEKRPMETVLRSPIYEGEA